MNLLLTNPQKIYIASLVALILLTILLVGIFLFKRLYPKKHYKEATYLVLSKLAKNEDYLLLNHFRINYDDTHVGVIDHILISKKYIFVINDFPLSGVISGEMKDRSLRLVKGKKEINNISNPLNYNINLIKRLNLYHRLDKDLVKGLVVVNNDAAVNMSRVGDQFIIIRRKELKKTIKSFDKDNVKNLKEDEIVNFINKLDRENRKRDYDQK